MLGVNALTSLRRKDRSDSVTTFVNYVLSLFSVDLTTVDMKTMESEGTTGDRVNQLVDIYQSKTTPGDTEGAYEGASEGATAGSDAHLQPTTAPPPPVASVSSPDNVSSQVHINHGYVAEETEITEFNVSPSDVTTVTIVPPTTSAEQLPTVPVATTSSEQPLTVPLTPTSSLNGRQTHAVPRSTSVVVSDEEKAGSVQQFWVLFRYIV